MDFMQICITVSLRYKKLEISLLLYLWYMMLYPHAARKVRRYQLQCFVLNASFFFWMQIVKSSVYSFIFCVTMMFFIDTEKEWNLFLLGVSAGQLSDQYFSLFFSKWMPLFLYRCLSGKKKTFLAVKRRGIKQWTDFAISNQM